MTAAERAPAALRARLAGRALLAGFGLVERLPEPVARGLVRAGTALAVRRDGEGPRQLRRNLRRVLGPDVGDRQLDDVVRRGMHSYGRYWIELIRLPATDPADVVARTVVNTWEHVDRLRAEGRPVIAALTHSGNWEAAGVVYRDYLGEDFVTVAERIRPPALFDRFVAQRRRLGMEVVPLTGGPRPVASVLTERLRAGRWICLLAERDLLGGGLEVDFFGAPAVMPPGPALLAATTGAALIPMNGSFTPDGWRLDFCPEIEIPSTGRLRDRVRDATQALARVFEQGIAAHPEDWHMLQPVWADDVAARPRR